MSSRLIVEAHTHTPGVATHIQVVVSFPYPVKKKPNPPFLPLKSYDIALTAGKLLPQACNRIHLTTYKPIH